jgi:hypothetical protein
MAGLICWIGFARGGGGAANVKVDKQTAVPTATAFCLQAIGHAAKLLSASEKLLSAFNCTAIQALPAIFQPG